MEENCLSHSVVDGLGVIRRLTSARHVWLPIKCKSTVIKQINRKGTEIHHINKTMCFLFTVNKDNWPFRREYLSHVTIIMLMDVYQPISPVHQNLCHPSIMVLIFSKF